MSGRRLRSSIAPSEMAGSLKSPSKILAEQLSTISVADDDSAPVGSDKKMRSSFRTGRKSCKENFIEHFGNSIDQRELEKTPSPPKTPKMTAPRSASTRSSKKNMAVQNTAKQMAMHTRPESSASDMSTSRKSASPVPSAESSENQQPIYHDAVLPSFTSFGGKKSKQALAAKRRTKKKILDAVLDDGEKMEETEEGKKQTPAKLAPVDLSWLSVDDLCDLIVPELESRRLVSDQLMQRYRKEFGKWVVQLLGGFNLLFHGLGSKHDMLIEFCDSKLIPGGFDVVEYDGWRPDFSFSDFIKELYYNYCRFDDGVKHSEAEMVDEIERYLNKMKGHVVIVVHSIDGVEIRGNRKFHATLASLATIPNVHVIASADHVNFPLMWDTSTAENLR